jgi:hypothetical protein
MSAVIILLFLILLCVMPWRAIANAIPFAVAGFIILISDHPVGLTIGFVVVCIVAMFIRQVWKASGGGSNEHRGAGKSVCQNQEAAEDDDRRRLHAGRSGVRRRQDRRDHVHVWDERGRSVRHLSTQVGRGSHPPAATTVSK